MIWACNHSASNILLSTNGTIWYAPLANYRSSRLIALSDPLLSNLWWIRITILSRNWMNCIAVWWTVVSASGGLVSVWGIPKVAYDWLCSIMIITCKCRIWKRICQKIVCNVNVGDPSHTPSSHTMKKRVSYLKYAWKSSFLQFYWQVSTLIFQLLATFWSLFSLECRLFQIYFCVNKN